MAGLDIQHPNVYGAEGVRPDTPGCLLGPGLSAEVNLRPILSEESQRGPANPSDSLWVITFNEMLSLNAWEVTCLLLPHSSGLLLTFPKSSSETSWRIK